MNVWIIDGTLTAADIKWSKKGKTYFSRLAFDKADGESVQKGHEKWIELQGWDWEVEAESSWTKGGGASAALERLKPFILNGDSSGLKFAMGNAQKDLGYYNEMASDSAAVAAIAQAVHSTYAQAAQEVGAGAMVPELIALLAKR